MKAISESKKRSKQVVICCILISTGEDCYNKHDLSSNLRMIKGNYK